MTCSDFPWIPAPIPRESEQLNRHEFLRRKHEITIDRAFIDGMHCFEFVLRDFINTERYMSWTSVIVFNDVLPPHCEGGGAPTMRRRPGGRCLQDPAGSQSVPA
jgi:hypothetical protein